MLAPSTPFSCCLNGISRKTTSLHFFHFNKRHVIVFSSSSSVIPTCFLMWMLHSNCSSPKPGQMQTPFFALFTVKCSCNLNVPVPRVFSPCAVFRMFSSFRLSVSVVPFMLSSGLSAAVYLACCLCSATQ